MCTLRRSTRVNLFGVIISNWKISRAKLSLKGISWIGRQSIVTSSFPRGKGKTGSTIAEIKQVNVTT